MASKTRKIVFVIAIFLLVATMLTACQLGTTLEGELEKFDLKAKVTYHANGGIINDTNNIESADVYYKDGDPILNLGTDKILDGSFFVKRDNYTLVGWYYPLIDGNGEIVYEKDADGNPTTKPESAGDFDFKNTKAQAGKEYNLYAHWMRNQRLEFLLAGDYTIDNKLVAGEKVYNVGDTLKEEDFGSSTYIEEALNYPLKDVLSGYTFVGYYYDAECTQAVDWPVYRTGGEENVKIYAKYLSGDWTVISNSTDLSKIFGKANANGKYYIKNDIVYNSNSAITVMADAKFTGEIRGNGFTISGVKFKNSAVRNNQTVSMLGSIESSAKISDITFKNCTAEYVASFNSFVNAYFFASTIADGASITNVTIDGGEMKVTATNKGSNWANSSTVCPIFEGTCDGIVLANVPSVKHEK